MGLYKVSGISSLPSHFTGISPYSLCQKKRTIRIFCDPPPAMGEGVKHVHGPLCVWDIGTRGGTNPKKLWVGLDRDSKGPEWNW